MKEEKEMKKLFVLLALALVGYLLLMPGVAMADGELPTEPFTWEYLATIAGATVARSERAHV